MRVFISLLLVGLSIAFGQPVAFPSENWETLSPGEVASVSTTSNAAVTFRATDRRFGSSVKSPPWTPMLGDGGLIQPRILVVSSRTFFMQNHATTASESNHPLPVNRVSYTFSSLQDVLIGSVANAPVSKSLQQHKLFLEKTFHEDLFSFEAIVPFYSTSEYHLNDTAEFLAGADKATQFGDIAFGLKALLHQDRNHIISGGLRFEVPTSQEISVLLNNYTLDDDVWHFTPYLAANWTSSNWFANGFLSYRMNSMGMTLRTPLATTILKEADYLNADLAIGRWLVCRPRQRGLTAVAPTLELHYSTTTTSERIPNSLVTNTNNLTGRLIDSSDYLTLTAGVHSRWGQNLIAHTGVFVPLRRNVQSVSIYPHPTDRTFDWGIMGGISYQFGGQL